MNKSSEQSESPLLLREATVQAIQLELIRRTRPGEFNDARVVADLAAHHDLWEAAMMDRRRSTMRTNHTAELPSAVEEPHARLEMMYMAEYLRGKNYRMPELASLSDADAKRLMEEASSYASLKLTEVEMGADFVDALQSDDTEIIAQLLARQRGRSQ